jgi:hypothetical protein
MARCIGAFTVRFVPPSKNKYSVVISTTLDRALRMEVHREPGMPA